MRIWEFRSWMDRLKKYYYLTKPGIIRGNLITAAAGFLFASKGNVDLGLLAATLAGIGLLIASACVSNNYIDRDIDAKMARTKKRSLVTGEISAKQALIFASILGASAFGLIASYVNWLTFFLGLIAYVDYIVLYGWTKRRSIHATLVGTVAGAMPITAGYTAASNSFDAAALLLFLILVLWQMPHFYAIGIYRGREYKAAKIPVLPLVHGNLAAKRQIIFYILGFILLSGLLSSLGYTGTIYLFVVTIAGFWWLWQGLQGFKASDDLRWARKMFGVSLVVLLVFSIMISLDSLPGVK
ncbi:heme o synthase [Candidatus Parcubacteria bacterium]|nr:heme o synthase [Candidatus Parcubacteria bacterium]